ncbi:MULTISPECIES: hypothetical protein [Microbacterium]|uniref:hypothetical protein n=1 Tax=Microbacterium TaxID=33882 RepID=UPI001269DDE3|nr:hypothetical protein [Microbacterium profundi]
MVLDAASRRTERHHATPPRRGPSRTRPLPHAAPPGATPPGAAPPRRGPSRRAPSVVYAKTLDADAWAALARSVTREYDERPTEVVSEAEFVWYSDGVEHHAVISLG